MDYAAFACKLPGCGGPRSGVCINNLAFEECPDVIPYKASDGVVVQAAEEETAVAVEPMIATQTSASFDARVCDQFLRRTNAIVVGIVAGPEVGKTTLIATMYELLYRRKMSNFRFAGSETLKGYEERCYLARVASNSAQPDTPRTPTRERLNFTHLRIATQKSVCNLVFSDRSGEHYQNALDRPGTFAEFVEVARATNIMLLVDLARLSIAPHQPMSEIRRLFMGMDQHGLMTEKRVALVGTKSDLLTTKEEQDRAKQALESIASDLERRSNHAVNVRPMVVSARRTAGLTQIGSGIEALLDWVLSASHLASAFAYGTTWPQRPTELDRLMESFRAPAK